MQQKELQESFSRNQKMAQKLLSVGISLLRNSQGMSLIELVIAVGVSGTLLGLSSTVYFHLSKLSRKAQVVSTISQMSHQYINLLSSDATLKNTLNKLTNTTPPYNYVTRTPFACLFSAQATACTGPTWTAGQKDHILQIYDNSRPETGSATKKLEPKILTTSSASDTPLAASQQTNGFDYSGQICSGFNSGSGSDSCPFQVRASWTPICPEEPPPARVLK